MTSTSRQVDRAPLLSFRERLDALDSDIIALFAKRYRIRDETMPVKMAHNMPIEVQERVDEVIEQAAQNAKKHNVPEDFARALYKLVIDYSHQYEEQYRKEQNGS